MNTITNKTDFDKNFYRIIASQRLLKENIAYLGVFAMCLSAYAGIKSLLNSASNISAYIYLAMGFILVPIFCFYIPYKTNCEYYEKAMKVTHNKPLIAEVKFSEDSFNMKNSLSQSEFHKYKDVDSIQVKKSLITINIKKSHPIYMNKDGFVDGTYNDFKLFIKQHSSIKFYD